MWSGDRPEQELRDRCSVTGENNLSQAQILKDIQDKNTVAPKDFFDDFQR